MNVPSWSHTLSVSALILATSACIRASAQAPLGACLYSLDQTAPQAFYIGGATSITSGCSIVVESTAANAFTIGDKETLNLGNHAEVGVVGGWQLSGSSLLDSISNQQVQPVKITTPGDPLASVAPPTQGTIVSSSPVTYNISNPPPNNALSPGVYCGGISITNPGGAEYTMSPGTYILAGGGLNVTSSADVVGSGVTIYNTSSAGWGCSKTYTYTPISINGQARVSLSAPASGPLAGVVLFGDRNGCATPGSCVDNINGQATAVFSGALYFKSDELVFNGGSTTDGCMEAIADTISINGHSTFGSQGCSVNPVSVAVTPQSEVLYATQQQAFSATVTNTYNTAVTWSISPSGVGTISSSGLYTAPSSVTAQQTVTVIATSQADGSANGSATITLSPPATPTITWATPAAITYGTALGAAQLDATANAPGTLVYSAQAGAVLSAGTHVLTATFTPADPNVYTAATASVTLTVNQASPAIAWATPAAITYGTALSATQLDATASVPGTFAYSPAAGTVPTAGSQTLLVTFTPTDATDYSPASASVTLTVNKVTPAITWATPAAITYGTALSGTQLDAAASVQGTFAYTPAAGMVLAAGSQALSVTFTPADATDYTTATASVTLAVNQATPAIGWATPAPIAYGTALGGAQLDAVANTPGSFVYSPSAGTVLSAGTQSLTTTFTPTDITDYTTATASVTLAVNQATPTITWATPAPITYGAALGAAQLDATANVSGTFTYSTAAGTVLPAGSQTLAVTFTPTDTADYTAATATVSLVVNQATPVITWAAPAPIIYGTALSAAQLDATANVPGTFAYSPAAGAILAAGSQTLVATFTPADTTDYATATATVTLAVSSPQCDTSGYGYVRAITIDHTRVSNTDQVNFPLLFEITIPSLATSANGGHVQSAAGNDILFSSDQGGSKPLDFEIEQYNPANGQLVAWIRIPTLSHSTDTAIYLLYGNAAIGASQQNPNGVWGSNAAGIWHFANGATLSAADSSASRNNGIVSGATAVSGEIDGAAGFNGSSYVALPQLNMGSAFSASAWFQTSLNGVILANTNASTAGASNSTFYNPVLYVGTDSKLRGGLYNFSGTPVNMLSSQNAVNDGKWHFAAYVTDGTTQRLYLDGRLQASASAGSNESLYYYVGVGFTGSWADVGSNWFYFNGSIDEVNLSRQVISADWVASEFNNQSSPSTFYSLSQENYEGVIPSSVVLFAGQSQSFVAEGDCGPVGWSLNPGAPGALTNSTYSAPLNVSSAQTVTITATDQASGANIGAATITVLPPPSITLAAASQPPYQTGGSQGFIATVTDSNGTPEAGVNVLFSVTGANPASGAATTDSSGIASFAYVGMNSGNDTISASSSYDNQPLASNKVVVSWSQAPPAATDGSVLLSAGPVLGITGLVGAFTDNIGTVIEPIAVGASPVSFVTPPGATQLQLGVIDNRYADNVGSGFTVAVNGVPVTVLPTSMPWLWVAGGLNTDYQYGLLDGTNPAVAATGLQPGQGVSIVYESGTVSAGVGWPNVNPDGDQAYIPRAQTNLSGIYFPTLFLTSTSYPVSHSINITAQVTNQSGSPLSNVPVTLTIQGANPQKVDAVTNSAGIAAFSYVGTTAGTDVLQAQAFPGGEAVIVSNQTSVSWVDYTAPPVGGSLTITPSTLQPLPAGGQQTFIVAAIDVSGAPVANNPVTLTISGVDNLQLTSTTDSTGHAIFNYQDVNPGTAFAVALSVIDGATAFSKSVTVPWTLPPATNSGSGGNGTLSIAISAPATVTLPNTLQLNGTATDGSLPAGESPSVNWSKVSGPGSVSFTNAAQATTTAAFSGPGTYVLQLSATDSLNSGSAQVSVVVEPAAQVAQGWIGQPINGSAVSGIVPITVATGETLQSGILAYYPASNPGNVTVLNPNTTGSSQIGTLDATTLSNGSYWITLQATDANGNSQYNLALVTVSGNYKPGRVTSTVTDLVVPATGLAINIQRTYDSLNAAVSSDFGYGWSLGINVNLAVDPKGDVTFTLAGQRKTFYFTPQPPPCSPLIGCLFPWLISPEWTPEPGLYGTLDSSGAGCPGGWDVLTATGECQTGGPYTPPGYIYTDPNGTTYTISASGALQSIVDRSGNGLTITSSGITSTTGLTVPFVRDARNRITTITDPKGNVYSYSYDASGNLASVTYPNTPQPSTYTYDPNHLYLSGTDFRNNPLPSTGYFTSADTDPNGLPLNGRLHTVTDGLGETTTYTYDLLAHSTTITYPPDAGGNVGTATMVYDVNGNLLTSTDPLNHTTTNTYDANLNLASVTDPLGNKTTYAYDVNGNKTSSSYPATATSTNTTSTTAYNLYSEPTSTTDEDGNVRAFNYDPSFNPASVTDSLGTLMSTLFYANGTMQTGAVGYDITQNPSRASKFAYDANGNLASKTDALGRTTSYTYDALGHKVAMVEPVPSGSTTAAATTTYQYDAFGNLTQTSAPLGRVTSSQYDANGNKTSDTDARSNTTQYQYDPLNRLIETDYPDGTKDIRTYDFRGNIVNETDQAGHITQHQYDLAGRQISVTQAYGTANAQTTTYAYDNANRKTGETDPLGHTTTYTYDAAGNLTAISGVKGNFQYAYDNARNRVSVTDGKGNTTKYQFDARKRLTETDYPDGTKKTNAYDGPGNLASVTDQAGNVVQYTYDAANQLQTVVQVNSPNSPSNTTTVGYDADGNPITVQDANLHATAASFDLLGEVTGKTLPDGTLTEKRQYDQNGNLTSLTHFNGDTTTYTYDQLNRLTQRATPGETTVGFTYTPTGKYRTSTGADGTTNYTYDSMDRITSKATPEGTLYYAYDAAGHVASISSSNVNGASMAYTYDSLNRLSTVTDNRLTGNNVSRYTYDAANNVFTITYPNGEQTQFQYDSLNRVTGAATQESGYVYHRGPAGNLTNVLELNGRTVTWNYDGIYRLTGETISSDPTNSNNGSIGYSLDPVGNRLSETSTLSGVPSGIFTVNADDEISSQTYDANGNVLTADGKSFSYDSENHLIGMNGGAVSITYDAFGNRAVKSANGVTTSYLVEDDVNPTGYPQVLDELTNGVVTRTYSYGLQRIDEDQVINNQWMPSFYGYDGMGNVRQLTNSNGEITDNYEYDAFGNSLTTSGATPNNYLYRGEEFDPDLGLYYLRARYYNPLSGRFENRDPNEPKLFGSNGMPIDPVTLHKYLYAGGDPVDKNDPNGREAMIEYLVKTVGKCTQQTGEGVGECTAGKINDDIKSYLYGNLFNGGKDTAEDFGNAMAKCINTAFTGIGNALDEIMSGEDPSNTDLDVAETLVGCVKPVLQEELGAVVYSATGNTPDAPEF